MTMFKPKCKYILLIITLNHNKDKNTTTTIRRGMMGLMWFSHNPNLIRDNNMLRGEGLLWFSLTRSLPLRRDQRTRCSAFCLRGETCWCFRGKIFLRVGFWDLEIVRDYGGGRWTHWNNELDSLYARMFYPTPWGPSSLLDCRFDVVRCRESHMNKESIFLLLNITRANKINQYIRILPLIVSGKEKCRLHRRDLYLSVESLPCCGDSVWWWETSMCSVTTSWNMVEGVGAARGGGPHLDDEGRDACYTVGQRVRAAVAQTAGFFPLFVLPLSLSCTGLVYFFLSTYLPLNKDSWILTSWSYFSLIVRYEICTMNYHDT